MLFSSIPFLYLFLPGVLFFDRLVLRKSRLAQNVFLLFASLAFYAWGEPKFVFVMMASIFVNWLFGLMIDRKRTRKTFCRWILILDVIINLSLLFVFKYLGFTGYIIQRLFRLDLRIPSIALPIGISFFTFQAMSYVIDVYRNKGKVQTNILYVGLYISFFPQLIAGPIVRYETIADEIKNRTETADDLFDGFSRFVTGLSKKVLLAKSFAVLADEVFETLKSGNPASVLFCWLGAVAYALQIYFDFSGYSDMAIGLGRMFGFHFLENFDYPYISSSVTEFWRRWHISLGTWFRDYLYIPLGGNRCGPVRNQLNLLAVWFLTGLWHGADLTFVAWGLMYYVLLTFERMTGLHNRKGRFLNIFKHLYTLLFVLIGWVIFRADSIGLAIRYLRAMFGLNGNALVDGLFAGWFEQNLILLVIGTVLSTPLFRALSEKTRNSALAGYLRVGGEIILFVLCIASLISSMYNPFIYFNF